MKKLIFAVCTVAAGSALLAADVESDNVYGIVNVASDTKTTVISVPWIGIDGTAVSVSNILSTASLADGDKLYYYEDPTWYEYTLSNGTWQPSTTSKTGSPTTQTGNPSKELSRGTALVLVRGNTVDHPILLGGKYDSTPKSETVTKGTTKLIGNPTGEAKSIGHAVGNVGDVIQVFGDDGSSTVYTKKADGWYGDQVVDLPAALGGGKTKASIKLDGDGVPVGAGRGMMYVCTDEADVKINW